MTEQKPLHVQQAEGLRALADMIEAHPELPASYLDSINVWHTTSPEMLAAIARAALSHGAKVKKEAFNTVYNLEMSWGVVGAAALAPRDSVCERVVTSTETVTKSVPDPEKLAEVPTVEVTETVEQVEWVCRPLLAAEKAPAVTS